MKRIHIFLDIDGVVATMNALDAAWEDYCGHKLTGLNWVQTAKKLGLPHPDTSMSHWPFDPVCITNIHQMQRELLAHNIKPKWVISSTWRIGRTEEELADLFELKGLHLMNLVGVTDHNSDPRGKQIIAWMEKNARGEQFIVIDDECDFDIRPHIDNKHLVETSFQHGFTATPRIDAVMKSIGLLEQKKSKV